MTTAKKLILLATLATAISYGASRLASDPWFGLVSFLTGIAAAVLWLVVIFVFLEVEP